jgi:hypothetical protein
MKTGLRILIAIVCLLGAASAAQNPAPMPAPAPAPFPASPDLAESMKAALKAQADAFAVQAQDLQGTQGDLRDWQMAFSADQADQARRAAEMLAQSTQSLRTFAYGSPQPFGTALREDLYARGQSDLERRRWDDAVQRFGQVAAASGPRADGALYWKAYALNKLGRRDEALAALADLRKAHSSSRWLDDAKALELEVKQAGGKPVSPDAESDEDLKIQALNGLRQADSERTVPALENVLKSAQSPKVKERALFVLAQSDSPKARQTVEQIARGGGNPDLQVKAISYLAAARRPQSGNVGQVLSEIYTSSNDIIVKRAVLSAFASSGESDRLLQIVKSEKAQDLKLQALNNYLSMRRSQDRRAIFGGQKPPTSADITPLYADQSPDAKRVIVNWLATEGDVKSVVALARSERDREMVRYIVGRLANMKSPEAADYLMEILNK